MHRRGLPGAADRAVYDAVKRRAGGVPGCEDTDRLLDEVRLVGRRGLRAGAVERRQVGIVVDLRQPDVGPVVAHRVVDEVRLERLGEYRFVPHRPADDVAHRALAQHRVADHAGVRRSGRRDRGRAYCRDTPIVTAAAVIRLARAHGSLIMPTGPPKQKAELPSRSGRRAIATYTAECGCAADTFGSRYGAGGPPCAAMDRLDHRDRRDPYPGRRVPASSGPPGQPGPMPGGNGPRGRRPSVRAFGTAGAEHPVVVMTVMHARRRGAGEEDDRHDENNAGDDHHPGRSLVEPRRLRYVRAEAEAGRGGRLELGFGCLGHPSIMPTRAPAIKHRAWSRGGVIRLMRWRRQRRTGRWLSS